MKYGTLPNGTTMLSPINSDISQYNAYTNSCAPGGRALRKAQFGTPMCGPHHQLASAAAPCYRPGGRPIATCRAGDVANPYWHSPAFGLLDPTAPYLPYSVFPGRIGSGVNAFNYPYVATLILNYKHDKFRSRRRSNSSRATATARR